MLLLFSRENRANIILMGATIAEWICPRLLSRGPGLWSQARHLRILKVKFCAIFAHDKYSTKLTLYDKSVDGVLGTQTRDGREDGRSRWIHWAMVAPPPIIVYIDSAKAYFNNNKLRNNNHHHNNKLHNTIPILISSFQCDQTGILFFNIWPLRAMKICPKLSNICQIRFTILPNAK